MIRRKTALSIQTVPLTFPSRPLARLAVDSVCKQTDSKPIASRLHPVAKPDVDFRRDTLKLTIDRLLSGLAG